MGRTLLRHTVAIAMLVLTACSWRSTQDTTRSVVVTREDFTAPSRCRPSEVAERIVAFFDAFNRGDQEALARFFGADFRWYAVADGAGAGFLAYNPEAEARLMSAGKDAKAGTAQETVLPYLAERHAHGEQLRLLSVSVSATPQEHEPAVWIHYNVSRRADDLKPGRGGAEQVAHGKGLVKCQTQTIAVWNMTPGEMAPVCPAPPSGSAPTAVIVCTYGSATGRLE